MENQHNAVAVQATEQNQVTAKLLNDYLNTITDKLTNAQRDQFIAVASAFGLNPFKREIYAVPYKNKNGGTDLSIVTGYEVYLKRAELNPNFDGYEVTFDGSLSRKNVTRNGKFGDYTETVIEPDGDFSCTCTVYRKDRNHPTVEQVFFDEFAQTNSMWKTKPRLMLKKVAIANAFRKAFPVEFGGMPYTNDELPDNMTGADRLQQQGLTEVKAEQSTPAPAQQKAQAPAAAQKTQAEKDANWQKACAAQRDRAPEVFDAFMKAHNVKAIANIKDSKSRKQFLDDVKATIDNANADNNEKTETQEANNG